MYRFDLRLYTSEKLQSIYLQEDVKNKVLTFDYADESYSKAQSYINEGRQKAKFLIAERINVAGFENLRNDFPYYEIIETLKNYTDTFFENVKLLNPDKALYKATSYNVYATVKKYFSLSDFLLNDGIYIAGIQE